MHVVPTTLMLQLVRRLLLYQILLSPELALQVHPDESCKRIERIDTLQAHV